ncbi:MAG: NADPH-dependent F420 reductase [Chloroflexi bacterium]|nr:NADPH-dependent F420 reductase [Chloroflexota bacterium]MQC26968.1 NADPH-dependent F420 reductase [Chloroflexota bacterium]
MTQKGDILPREEGKRPVVALIGGTGNLGPGLALRWAHAGYPVIIGSRAADKAQATAVELNAELGNELIVGMENVAAIQAAEICVLTVVQGVHEAALSDLKDELKGKLLIDATARMEFPKITPPAPPSAGRIAQTMLGDEVRVVTAFQNVPASAVRKNFRHPLDSDVLVCADDVGAAEEAMGLATDAGMRAFYAGDLDKAIVVEGLTSLLVSMNRHYKVHGATIKVAGISSHQTE